MTEEQWLTCTEPEKMLDFLHKARKRKLRLFAVAACRRLQGSWDCALEAAERYADGLVSLGELMDIRTALLGNASTMYRHMGREEVEAYEALIRAVTEPHANEAALLTVEMATTVLQRVTLCDSLREIFGNPFRAFTLSPTYHSWNDAVVVRLAQTAYGNRILPARILDNARLAILADALEEAGCSDEQILTHLRSSGDHYRGCFVVDALLGKS
ncbi:MAG TPA: hypothetical protein VH682_29920 [Gemmataceae bacterium]|jgi:hypothetical protein